MGLHVTMPPVLLQRPEREVPMTDFVDTRVDVCLYFIAPHALLPADIATIRRLGRMVPIVPIIAKVCLYALVIAACDGRAEPLIIHVRRSCTCAPRMCAASEP